MDRAKRLFCSLGRMCLKSRKILLTALAFYVCSAIVLYFADPLFHTHEHTKWVLTKAPTCISWGTEEARCYCGDAITRSVGFANHTFGPWQTDRPATQAEDGQRSRYCTLCNARESIPILAVDPAVHGSAGWIGNTTVVVSIFANDQVTYWDPNFTQDQAEQESLLKTLQISIDWITEQCARYDAYPNFIYDWREDPDLSYSHTFWELDFSVKRTRDYKSQRDYIQENIPSQQLLERYQAQNIIYLFFFDTDEKNTSMSYGYYDHPYYNFEVINLFDQYLSTAKAFQYWELTPELTTVLLLRSFGVPPLWCPSDLLPEGYRTHLKNMGPRDIMSSYTYIGGDKINYLLSEFDAYYLGLIDDFADARTWGLTRRSFR